MALENQHFDLEFFMKSTDVGLYDVAKKIFSHLDPVDLANLGEIGKTNKTFDEFLKKERDFLWKKFEEATLKILKTGQVIACIGGTHRHFDPELLMKSTDAGLYNVAKKIFSHLDPVDLNNLGEIGKTNKTFEEFLKKEKDFLWKKFEKVSLKIFHLDFPGETRRMLENTYRVSCTKKRLFESTLDLTITGNLQGVFNAVNHFQYHLNQNDERPGSLMFFQMMNYEVLDSLLEKRMNQLELESKKPTDPSDKL